MCGALKQQQQQFSAKMLMLMLMHFNDDAGAGADSEDALDDDDGAGSGAIFRLAQNSTREKGQSDSSWRWAELEGRAIYSYHVCVMSWMEEEVGCSATVGDNAGGGGGGEQTWMRRQEEKEMLLCVKQCVHW